MGEHQRSQGGHQGDGVITVRGRLVALGRPVRHLRPLVDVVFAGDSFKARGRYKDEYAESKRAGFHRA